MKLMLACAFSHNAKLLILDEPTSGLDPATRNEFLEILQEFIQDGEKSVLFSTHINFLKKFSLLGIKSHPHWRVLVRKEVEAFSL